MPTALDTRAETEEPARTVPASDRHRNSPLTTTAIVLGALIFGGLCLLLAFGGGGDSNPVVTTSTAPSSNETAAPAASNEAVPAAQEPVDQAPIGDDPVTENAPAAAEAPAEEEPSSEEVPAAEEEPSEDAPAAEEAPVEVFRAAVIGPDSPAAPVNPPEVYSILADGKLYMRGSVPSTEVERQVVAAVEALMGPGNAISEYAIDPDLELTEGDGAPVYLGDKISFPSGSTEISPEFTELLSIVPILLSLQDDVTVTVNGHTDDVGSADANLALSQARVDSVRNWLIEQGGDGDRIFATGYGETQPITENETEEGRETNRRVEFIIEGFNFELG